jgi:hypothetical protein
MSNLTLIIRVSLLETQFLKVWGFFPRTFTNCVSRGEGLSTGCAPCCL